MSRLSRAGLRLRRTQIRGSWLFLLGQIRELRREARERPEMGGGIGAGRREGGEGGRCGREGGGTGGCAQQPAQAEPEGEAGRETQRLAAKCHRTDGPFFLLEPAQVERPRRLERRRDGGARQFERG